MADKSLSAIREFLAQHRIAMIGASRSDKDFSAKLFTDLRRAGYDVVPVNPNATEIGGVQCFPRVQDIAPPVDAALIMLPSAHAAPAIRDCSDAGIRRVWLYGFKGPSKIDPAALQTCRELGLSAIAGYCPYMFLPNGAWFHRAHGWVTRLVGAYPT
ncbi:MAG TPA: CoA-binding protein [Bryobacteraceae bacterium]|nr:CoA-binding protein [Bryobacteraceae bacterium]